MSLTVEDYVDHPECRGDLEPSAVASLFLTRIAERVDLFAVVSVSEDRVQQDAQRAAAARRAGKPLPLDGLPILVKDNIDVAGVPCRVGSPLFADRVSATDAECVRRLSEAGAVVLGKTTLHELVYGGTTDSPFYGRTKNPWDLERIVGGSSGGSGAAVAAGLCAVALGSDTGGSIRLPAHLNGVVGMRPTYGSVSVRGAQPIGASLDTVGTLARHARDAAAVQSVITGQDWNDTWSIEVPRPPRTAMRTAAVLDERTIGTIEPGVRARVEDAVAALNRLGVATRARHLQGFAQAREDASRVVRVEAWTLYKADLAATPEKFSDETTDRLRSGAVVSIDELMSSVWRVAEWRQGIRRLLAEEVDLLVLPSVPIVAPVAGSTGMIAATALLTSLTSPISAAHVPAVSVPCGLADGLPVGVQLVAAPGRDQDLLALAAQLQSLFPPPWPPGLTQDRRKS